MMRPPIPRLTFVDPPVIAKGEKAMTVKFIDDATVATTVNLKKGLISDPIQRPRPLNLEESSGHILPPKNNLLQYYIDDVEEFARINKMKINNEKTQVMKFSRSKKFKFPPEITFSNGNIITNVNQVKLLGVIITEDLKWAQNTLHIVNKAMKSLWTLRRLKELHMERNFLIEVKIK